MDDGAGGHRRHPKDARGCFSGATSVSQNNSLDPLAGAYAWSVGSFDSKLTRGAVAFQWHASAAAGTNYGTPGNASALSGVLSWGDGDFSPRQISVGGGGSIPLIQNSGTDVYYEPGFWITLSQPTGGAAVGTIPTTKVNITDDDSRIGFSSSYVGVTEGGRLEALAVVRSGDLSSEATVSWRTVNDTALAGSDFGAPGVTDATTGVLHFAPGETDKFIYVGKAPAPGAFIPIIADGVAEGPESFSVELFSPTGNATVGPIPTATVAISSIESAVRFNAAAVDASEGDGYAVVQVDLYGNHSGPVSVAYSTADGTAIRPFPPPAGLAARWAGRPAPGSGSQRPRRPCIRPRNNPTRTLR